MTLVWHDMTCRTCNGFGVAYTRDHRWYLCCSCGGHGWVGHRVVAMAMLLPEQAKDISWLWKDNDQ
jgi:DnaJ-class molecular chaperone